MNSLFNYIDNRSNDFIKLLEDLVSINSYTPDKSDVDKVGDRIKAFSENEGFQVSVTPFEKAGDGLLITLNRDAELAPIVFTGHMDTVFPKGTFSAPLFRKENGKCFGPGVVDMKGGLVTGLLAMSAIRDSGWDKRPVKFIMIGDEELSEGLSGDAGKDFIRNNARGSAAAITLEGCTDKHTVTVGRKGSIRYKVYVKGHAAHAGSAYSEGISAIKEAAQKILAIEAPSDQAQITYNCGMINGGTAPNTVPGEAMFTLYNRYWEIAQRNEIRKHVEGIISHSYIPGTSSSFDIVGERLPMEAAPENYSLACYISSISQKYGFGPMTPVKRPGGSDASYTAMAGAPSVCSMGVIGGRAHSTDEYIYADSIAERAKLLTAVITEFPDSLGDY